MRLRSNNTVSLALVRPTTADLAAAILLDSTAPNRYCANFAYIAGRGLMIVPSLTDNRITAFMWNRADDEK